MMCVFETMFSVVKLQKKNVTNVTNVTCFFETKAVAFIILILLSILFVILLYIYKQVLMSFFSV